MTHTYLALLVQLLALPPGDPPSGTLESVDRVRGGRHWVDLPTDPPRSPEESRQAFDIDEGLEIRLFAAEPLVVDPVAIAFDENGRAFVVEYRDYPIGPVKANGEVDDAAPRLSRIVVLEDTDGDFRADKSTVFAEHLDFAHSLLPYDGGVIVGARTRILFLKDTDGDLKADVNEVLYEGFTPAHPQMQIGNPRYGLDNRIYCNYGPGTITSPKRPGERIEMPRSEFVFDPRTWEFGPAAGLGQFGNTIDNWGRRFFCTNRNPIITAPIPYEIAKRNKYAPLSNLEYDVAPSGGDAGIRPLVPMRSNYLSHAGTYTAACGVTAYLGDLLGPNYADNVFVCEPIGHLVTRSRIVEEGVELRAERMGDGRDFLASKDTWFRPASLATGPDGALYVADMYRLWVEHPKFLPEDVAAKIDWRGGDDRGRIWRIVPKGAEVRPFTPPETTAARVALLMDPNGWRRELGQRLIVERQEQEAIDGVREVYFTRRSALREIASAIPSAAHQIRALRTLGGLDAIEDSEIVAGLRSPDVRVRREVVRVARERVGTNSAFGGSLEDLAESDRDPRLRFEILLGFGGIDDPRAPTVIASMARGEGSIPWVRDAVLTATETRSGAVLGHLVADDDWAAKGDANKIDLVRRLAAVVGARGDLVELGGLLTLLGGDDESGAWWRTAALTGLAEGLPRQRGDLGRTSLAALVAKPPRELAAAMPAVRRRIDEAERIAADAGRAVGDRLAAIQLLATQPFEAYSETYRRLLEPNQPFAVQVATIESLRKGGEAAGKVVLDAWPTLGPKLRGPALSLLFTRGDTGRMTLAAMQEGRIETSAVDLADRIRLLRNRDEEIRKLATDLFGGAVSANRREVAEQYEPAIVAKGNVELGRQVFVKSCSKCHKLDGVGHEVGPDISDVRNRARDALLHDILDPNRKVEPKFAEYSVVTTDGLLVNGLLVAETETTLVLRRPEGKEQTVDRGDVEILKATGKSLMPEGVEKEVTVEQMGDLLEFLTNRAGGK